MAFNNYNSFEEDFQPGVCYLKAKTKIRAGRDGNTNRGLLIVNNQQQERWVSVPTVDAITSLPLGTQLHFNGSGARPSLSYSPPPQQQAYSQQHASLGDAIANGYTAPQQKEVDFQNNARAYSNQQKMQPQVDQSRANEERLENIATVLSNAVNLLTMLNPQLSEDSVVKLAISASIQYYKQ